LNGLSLVKMSRVVRARCRLLKTRLGCSDGLTTPTLIWLRVAPIMTRNKKGLKQILEEFCLLSQMRSKNGLSLASPSPEKDPSICLRK
jgi:hypothetical protein